jgi:hypothetical protein
VPAEGFFSEPLKITAPDCRFVTVTLPSSMLNLTSWSIAWTAVEPEVSGVVTP